MSRTDLGPTPGTTAQVRVPRDAPLVAQRDASSAPALVGPRPARHHWISAGVIAKLVDKRWHAFLWAAGGLYSLMAVQYGLEGAALGLLFYLGPCAGLSASCFAVGGSLLALRRRALRADLQALRVAGAPPEELHALADGLTRARPDEIPRLEARADYLFERIAAGERVSVAPLHVEGAEPDDPRFFRGGLAEMGKHGSATSELFGERDVREPTVQRDAESLTLRATATGARVAAVDRLRTQLADASEFSFTHQGDQLTVVCVSFATGANGRWRHTLDVQLDDESHAALARAFADAPRARPLDLRIELRMASG